MQQMQKKLPTTLSGMTKLIQILSIISLLLICVLYFLEFSKPEVRFFARTTVSSAAATTSDQSSTINDSAATTIKEIFPLNEPNIATKTLLRWATLAATNAYTLDFVNYEDTIEKLRSFFTNAGHKNFLAALAANNRLADIIEQKLVVTAVNHGQPILLTEGELLGLYSWKVQVPLLLNYQGASEQSTQQRIAVTMLITRVPTTEAIAGIGITQIQDQELFE